MELYQKIPINIPMIYPKQSPGDGHPACHKLELRGCSLGHWTDHLEKSRNLRGNKRGEKCETDGKIMGRLHEISSINKKNGNLLEICLNHD